MLLLITEVPLRRPSMMTRVTAIVYNAAHTHCDAIFIHMLVVPRFSSSFSGVPRKDQFDNAIACTLHANRLQLADLAQAFSLGKALGWGKVKPVSSRIGMTVYVSSNDAHL